VVALSLVYPPDDALLRDELRRLRRLLGPHTGMIVGGRCCIRLGRPAPLIFSGLRGKSTALLVPGDDS
jgi:hypothetical protein